MSSGGGEAADSWADDPATNGVTVINDRETIPDWRIYTGSGRPHDGIDRLPEPPPWRAFGKGLGDVPDVVDNVVATPSARAAGRGSAYLATDVDVDMVNTALYLRRPLLITGKPGTGKSSMAFSIAFELSLGPVLYWPITSRSTLQDGLYRYDAIGRLQESNLYRGADPAVVEAVPDIGRFVRLGPLGTALLPRRRPRVVLIDELDKSDIDLPNDLLNVFEEGQFEIPELLRLPPSRDIVEVMTHDGRTPAPVVRGRVACRDFPIVVITSNGEREFPPAFLRRCVRLDMQPPDADRLTKIVQSLLGATVDGEQARFIADFVSRRAQGDLATDQLLNVLHLVAGGRLPEGARERVTEALFRPLDVGVV